MEQEAGQLEWWLAVVGERTAHRQAVPANHRCGWICSGSHAPLNVPYAPHILLEFRLHMVVGRRDRFGSLLEIVVLAELVGDVGQHGTDRHPDGVLSIRDHGLDRDRQTARDLAQEIRQVGFPRAIQAAREQDLAGEAITQHP